MERRLFQLIDLDRTLFDTSRFAKALTDEIDLTEPGVGAQLDEEFEAAYKNEETFFLLRSLRETRGDEWFESLVERVVEKIGASSLILAGVKERLDTVDTVTSHRPSWGILTYGDEIDQRMKTQLVGFQNVPFLLTTTPDKGEVIDSWKQLDGTFQLPEEFGGGVVDHITLEDDKLRAFKGLPDGARGFWVTSDPSAEARLAEATTSGVIQNVMVVKDLSTVASKLIS